MVTCRSAGNEASRFRARHWLMLLCLLVAGPAAGAPQDWDRLAEGVEHLGAGRYREAVVTAYALYRTAAETAVLIEAEQLWVESYRQRGDSAGALRRARILLAEVKVKRPASGEVAALEGLILRVQEAEQAYRRRLAELEATAAARPGTEEAARAAYEIAVLHLAAGKINEAVAACNRVGVDYPDSDEARRARLLQAQAYEQRGLREAARLVYESLLAASPNTLYGAQAVRSLKRLDIADRDYAVAESRLSEVIRTYPGTEAAAEALFGLGDLAWIRKQWDLSHGYYRRVVAEYPGSAAAREAEARGRFVTPPEG